MFIQPHDSNQSKESYDTNNSCNSASSCCLCQISCSTIICSGVSLAKDNIPEPANISYHWNCRNYVQIEEERVQVTIHNQAGQNNLECKGTNAACSDSVESVIGRLVECNDPNVIEKQCIYCDEGHDRDVDIVVKDFLDEDFPVEQLHLRVAVFLQNNLVLVLLHLLLVLFLKYFDESSLFLSLILIDVLNEFIILSFKWADIPLLETLLLSYLLYCHFLLQLFFEVCFRWFIQMFGRGMIVFFYLLLDVKSNLTAFVVEDFLLSLALFEWLLLDIRFIGLPHQGIDSSFWNHIKYNWFTWHGNWQIRFDFIVQVFITWVNWIGCWIHVIARVELGLVHTLWVYLAYSRLLVIIIVLQVATYSFCFYTVILFWFCIMSEVRTSNA